MWEITVEATIDKLYAVTEFVETHLAALNCPRKVILQVDIAIDELFTNIVQYAYGSKPGPVTVRVEFEDTPPTVAITFMDSGIPYDPLQRADPDITLPVEERDAGGLGIFLVKKSMDNVDRKSVV